MITTGHLKLIDTRIERWCAALPVDPLHAPMRYLLQLPAKRVRPALVLLGCELFGGRAEDTLDEALGIELFHNFTLMHDDVMDAAPLRRGQPTVHAKWNVNTAILSGDALLVKAYELMARRSDVLALFSRYALLVCQGQQRDMDLENEEDVALEDYMTMIRAKTAVLLNCALQVGAAVAGASNEDRDRAGLFGEDLGLAFQLRDDVLDAFGDPGVTGKQRGGDLRAGKKTWLMIRGLERAEEEGMSALHEELMKPGVARNVERMLFALEELGVKAEAEAEVQHLHHEALRALEAIAVPEERKRPLRDLAAMLLGRDR